jgi:hypothetical protein
MLICILVRCRGKPHAVSPDGVLAPREASQIELREDLEDRLKEYSDHHRPGAMLPTCNTGGPSERRASVLQILEQRSQARPRPPQAAAAVDARIQAACQRRHFLSGPRADPESAQRFLDAYRHSPAPLAPPEGVAATSAGDLALT